MRQADRLRSGMLRLNLWRPNLDAYRPCSRLDDTKDVYADNNDPFASATLCMYGIACIEATDYQHRRGQSEPTS